MKNIIGYIGLLGFVLLTACTLPKIRLPKKNEKAVSVLPTAKEEKVKPEPLSRYGNPESYKVFGQTYSVLRSSGGYKVKGIASWYGTDFHRKRTSSGEQYNMYALTAAHKTLPLPTYVKVKNLSNKREVIVKVNDRGPFHKGRVIDLSYAAAKQLGFVHRGTVPVEIEALTKEKQVAHYFLQAGAFKTEKLASLLQNKVSQLISSPVAVEKHADHYVVKLGPFLDKEKTEELKKKLDMNGIFGAFSLLQ